MWSVNVNTDRMTGYWRQFFGRAKDKLSGQSDGDWEIVKDERDPLAGKLHERVGKIQRRYRNAGDNAEAEAERALEHIWNRRAR
jgi:uncharacterized protein YjbJ (UPF0337 family)